MGAPPNPKKEGYDFEGWYFDRNGKVEYDFSDEVTGGFTLYAVYSEAADYEVVFNLNGGKGIVPKTQNKKIGEYIDDPGDAEWEDESKIFSGWTTVRNSESVVWDFEKDKMPGKNLTLYALWMDNDMDFSGMGTSSSPYILKSDEDIKLLSEKVVGGETYEGRCFLLDSDGVCTSSIGTRAHPFMGIFDGCGKTVTVNINSSSDYQGLFGYVKDGIIENVAVTGNVQGGSYVGGVAGYIISGTINNCISSVEIKATGSYVGGICGYGAAASSENSGRVSGTQYVGGIAGKATADISDCKNSGEVSGKDGYVGGIAGDGVNCNFSGCINAGAVSISGNITGGDEKAYTGGIAGILSYAGSCINSGTVNGASRTGGIAGRVTGSAEQCDNNGAISGTIRAGGIAGSLATNSIIKNCISTGSITSSGSYAGGISGDCESGSSIENSYCLAMVESGGSYAGGIAAKGGTIKNSFYYNEKNKGWQAIWRRKWKPSRSGLKPLSARMRAYGARIWRAGTGAK